MRCGRCKDRKLNSVLRFFFSAWRALKREYEVRMNVSSASYARSIKKALHTKRDKGTNERAQSEIECSQLIHDSGGGWRGNITKLSDSITAPTSDSVHNDVIKVYALLAEKAEAREIKWNQCYNEIKDNWSISLRFMGNLAPNHFSTFERLLDADIKPAWAGNRLIDFRKCLTAELTSMHRAWALMGLLLILGESNLGLSNLCAVEIINLRW